MRLETELEFVDAEITTYRRTSTRRFTRTTTWFADASHLSRSPFRDSPDVTGTNAVERENSPSIMGLADDSDR